MHTVFYEVLYVRISRKEPKKFMDNTFEKNLFRRQQGEAFGQIESHLMSEYGPRSYSGPVRFIHPLFQYPAE